MSSRRSSTAARHIAASRSHQRQRIAAARQGREQQRAKLMRALYTLLGGFALFAASLHGQTAKPAAPSPTAAAPTPKPSAPVKEIVLTATTANVKESGTPVSIRLFRWSTDEERTALVSAFTAPAGGRPGGAGRPAAPPDAGQGQTQRGQGQGRAAQGQPQRQDQDDPAQQDQDEPAQAPQGRAQGAGRGRASGSAAAPAPITPFMQAIQRAPNLGYLWTNEPTGYSVKHAWRKSEPDGSERVVLVIEPRLGAYSPAWTQRQVPLPTTALRCSSSGSTPRLPRVSRR